MSGHPQGGRRGGGLGAIALLMLLQTAIVLGGVYLMLSAFGDSLDSELDRQVDRVERNLDRDFETIREEIRRELDERLPDAAPVP